MGFFSNLLDIGKSLLPVAATVLGFPSAGVGTDLGAKTAAAIVTSTPAGQDIVRQSIAARTTGTTRPRITITDRTMRKDGVEIGEKNFVETVVQTFAPDGTIIREKVFAGAPFLMKKDLVIAKRVFKLASKLHGKLPRRTMKQSEMSKLNEAILDKAKSNLLTGPTCPPKC